jgi:hypothetical protein
MPDRLAGGMGGAGQCRGKRECPRLPAVCAGGLGVTTYTYVSNPTASTDYNNWQQEVIEDQPDGSQMGNA